jgi:multidrug efflux pump subunit AcrA (membrane-fusion protein)
MAIDLPNADERLDDEAWREIDQCLADVSALAAQPLDDREFYSAVVEKARWALTASAASTWIRDGEGEWFEFTRAADGAAEGSHRQQVAQVAARREPRLLPPRSAGNSGAAACAMAPVVVDGCVLAVIEVFTAADSSTSAMEGQRRFVVALADCAAEYHRNALLRQLRGREAWWRNFADFSARIADARDLSRAAMEMANGARSLLNADRASIVSWSQGRARMQAVSGVDAFDRRAETVLAAEAIATAVLQVNEPLWFPTAGEVLAPQVEEALARQLDASPTKTLAVIPLAVEGATPCGALLLERFALQESHATWHDGWPHVARQCAGALEGALAWEALPLGAWSRRVAAARRTGMSRRAVNWGLAALAIIVALTAIGFVPATFEVNAPGVLQPTGLRHLYGGIEGEVIEVLARSGETVSKDQVLLRLRSPKLDLETTRVLGELQTAQARLATLESARLENRFSTPEDVAKAQQLTAEEEELRESVKSLVAQQTVLNDERRLLEVRSPIAGKIVTPWDELDALPARPVRTGQKLLTVADVAGPWELQLQAPDHLIGHVQPPSPESTPTPNVRFVVSTDSRTEHLATVKTVALRAETDADGKASVLVTADVDGALDQPRPGATVNARIAGERRPLAYVWFHELYDRVATWWTLHT